MTSWPRTEWYILLASVMWWSAAQAITNMLNLAMSHFAETGKDLLWKAVMAETQSRAHAVFTRQLVRTYRMPGLL